MNRYGTPEVIGEAVKYSNKAVNRGRPLCRRLLDRGVSERRGVEMAVVDVRVF